MRTPYLVQRGKITKREVDRLSNCIKLDYMGSAEFEFGALPKSLRAMQDINFPRGDIKVRTIKDFTYLDGPFSNHENTVGWSPSGGNCLRVVSGLTDEEFTEYLEHLKKIWNEKIHLKERSCFNKDSIHGNPKYSWSKPQGFDFWWDIENHVMWTFDKWIGNNLVQILYKSWEYMDSQK